MGGGGRTGTTAALHSEGGGRVRGEIERGKGGDAPRARNRHGTHRGRRIDGGRRSSGAAVMEEGEGLGFGAESRSGTGARGEREQAAVRIRMHAERG